VSSHKSQTTAFQKEISLQQHRFKWLQYTTTFQIFHTSSPHLLFGTILISFCSADVFSRVRDIWKWIKLKSSRSSHKKPSRQILVVCASKIWLDSELLNRRSWGKHRKPGRKVTPCRNINSEPQNGSS
jgi:hypothetical protein